MLAHRFERSRLGLQKRDTIWCIACLLIGVPAFAAAQSNANANAEKTLALSIINGTLPANQALIKVYQGDRLRWRITSDRPGDLHLHGYRLKAQLQAGQAREVAFTAFATGRFRLEWHAADAMSPAAVAHHAPALAMLEVRPR